MILFCVLLRRTLPYYMVFYIVSKSYLCCVTFLFILLSFVLHCTCAALYPMHRLDIFCTAFDQLYCIVLKCAVNVANVRNTFEKNRSTNVAVVQNIILAAAII